MKQAKRKTGNKTTKKAKTAKNSTKLKATGKATQVASAKGKKAPSRGKRATALKAAPSESLPPTSGPVTLDEARALARVQRPQLAMRAAARDLQPPASPATVGAEREKLRREQRNERADRIREYKAVMDVMKKRGARGPRARAAARIDADEPPSESTSFAPLQILAEGDSWFDYPIPLFGGGIIPRLENRLGVPILNLAKAGDEVRYMLGVEERAVLTDQLTNGSPSGGPWDVLLFSGGGNDIVDNPMALWIKDWQPGQPPASHIHQQRFSAALTLVRAGYEDLITLRDALSPNTVLVFQGYDFAIPDGRGVCGFGPWLKPTFDLRKFPTTSDAAQVVKAMLQQFAAMLSSLTAHPRVTFINGQGTLAPQKSSWHNELHPARTGFEQFADIFQHDLKVLFPDRVA